uniref:Uncharacterized protein n=1 Tax=Ditylenchus dipsaci TaxID=166011 RepID=A0A915E0U6_9BILA
MGLNLDSYKHLILEDILKYFLAKRKVLRSTDYSTKDPKLSALEEEALNNASGRRRKTSQSAIEKRNLEAKKEADKEEILTSKGVNVPAAGEEPKMGSAVTTIVMFRKPQERSYVDTEGKVCCFGEDAKQQSCSSSSITNSAAETEVIVVLVVVCPINPTTPPITPQLPTITITITPPIA